ncbi:MAG: hypothetical protein ACK463_30230, partial [Bradyrhizobium sp.]
LDRRGHTELVTRDLCRKAERQGWVADLADEGVFGAKGTAEFARSADWRTEADRILARIKS